MTAVSPFWPFAARCLSGEADLHPKSAAKQCADEGVVRLDRGIDRFASHCVRCAWRPSFEEAPTEGGIQTPLQARNKSPQPSRFRKNFLRTGEISSIKPP